MRAVVPLSAEQLAERRSKGLDRFDEEWEGVLHMTPAPSVEHQRVVDGLVMFLGPLLRDDGRGQLFSNINVFRRSGDYRIPDLTFVATGREAVLHDDGVRGEGPDAVFEVRSPHDETYDKLPFYAAIGVREFVVIDRDTKRPEIYRLAGAQFVVLQADADGWLRSESMAVRFRVAAGQPPRLVVEDGMDVAVRAEI